MKILASKESLLPVQAIIDIDIVDVETGEVLETFEDVWLGDAKSIYKNYNVVKIDRDSDRRTVWVHQ